MNKRFATLALAALLSAAPAAPAYANAPFESPTLQLIWDGETPDYRYGRYAHQHSFIQDLTAGTAYGGLAFETEGDSGPFGDPEILQPKHITISEDTAGVLEAGKKLYLRVENLQFDKSLAVGLLQGDLAFEYTVNDLGWLELTVRKESTTPAVLKIHEMAVVMGRRQIQPERETTKYAYCYPLVLVTDKNAPDNLFDAAENVLLAPHFIVQQQRWGELCYAFFPFDRITAGGGGFSVNGAQYPLSHPCYVRDGALMVPVKECMEAYYAHYGIDMCMEWDAQAETMAAADGRKLFVSLGTNTRSDRQDGGAALYHPAEWKDGVLYIAFRDFIGMTIENKRYGFYWDVRQKTASYRMEP